MVATDPADAQVSSSDGRSGITPYSIRVDRNQDIQLNISKTGYTPTDVSDNSHVEWGYVVADIFLTGLIGLGIDGMDGAMFEHNQTMVTAHLEPLPGAAPAGPAAAATQPTGSTTGSDATKIN